MKFTLRKTLCPHLVVYKQINVSITKRMGAGGSHDDELRPEEIAELVEVSGFTRAEVEHLYHRFRRLDSKGHGYLTKQELLRIPELAMSPIVDRVIAHFNFADLDRLNFTQFVKAMSSKHLRHREPSVLGINEKILAFNKAASTAEKAKAAFSVFDIDKDGFISKTDLTTIMRSMVGTNVEEPELQQMVASIISEGDRDGDGKLSEREFKRILYGVDLENELTLDYKAEQP